MIILLLLYEQFFKSDNHTCVGKNYYLICSFLLLKDTWIYECHCVNVLERSLDINECSTSIGGCEEIYTNTNGSFICSCQNVYMLCDDKRTCIGINNWYDYNILNIILIDINECTINNGGCEQTCVNDVGTYNCYCRHGCNLNSDNHTCDGKLY